MMSGDKKELILDAKIEKTREATEFIITTLTGMGCPDKQADRIALAVEELFVNVAKYAYPDGDGWVRIIMDFPRTAAVIIEIYDGGTPYDPSQKEDPDVTLPFRDRSIGGLGIFMAKKIMDEIEYDYTDGHNHVVMKKAWEKEELEPYSRMEEVHPTSEISAKKAEEVGAKLIEAVED